MQKQTEAPGLSVVLGATLWLAVFLSPTGYFLLLAFADRWQVPAPPEALVVALFLIIPVVALLLCGSMVWKSVRDLRWRVGVLGLTLLGMLLQCGVLLLILVSAMIAPAQ